MNIYRFDLYLDPQDIYNKLEPSQKEQIGSVVITNAQLGGDGYVHIECAALEKGIEITPKKQPAYRQSLIDDGSYIIAIEDDRYIAAIEN